jgi:hypothetical protein
VASTSRRSLATRHLSLVTAPEVSQSHQMGQLLVGQARGIPKVDTRVIIRRLALGSPAQSLPLLFSELPAPDIFGLTEYETVYAIMNRWK